MPLLPINCEEMNEQVFLNGSSDNTHCNQLSLGISRVYNISEILVENDFKSVLELMADALNRSILELGEVLRHVCEVIKSYDKENRCFRIMYVLINTEVNYRSKKAY